MEMVSGGEGQESENQLVCVYRYTVIWTGSGNDEEAYESVNGIGFDIDEVRASDIDEVKGSGISHVEHLVSDFDFESASSPFVDRENLGGRISLLTSLWSSGDDHRP
jgi:hypothetical protein